MLYGQFFALIYNITHGTSGLGTWSGWVECMKPAELTAVKQFDDDELYQNIDKNLTPSFPRSYFASLGGLTSVTLVLQP